MMRITPYSRQLHRIVQHIQRTNHVLQDILVDRHQRHSSTLPLASTITAQFLRTSRQLAAFPISVAQQQARAIFSIAHFASAGKSEQKDDEKKGAEKTTGKPTADKQQQQQSSQNDDDDDDEKKRERMLSVFTKAVLWMATIYGMSLVLALLLPRKNRPETSTRYVSWHEFVHHMLAKGEVREIIIRPDMDLVTVVLHDGAVIKGRQYQSNVFHMAVADAAKFEQKLRDVEARLGVRDSVTITYERNSDVIPKLLVTLLLTGAVFAVLSRMKGFKSPISMDSIVSALGSHSVVY